jgi:hypothetical protein
MPDGTRTLLNLELEADATNEYLYAELIKIYRDRFERVVGVPPDGNLVSICFKDRKIPIQLRPPKPSQTFKYSVIFEGTMDLPADGTELQSKALYDEITSQISRTIQESPSKIIVISTAGKDDIIVFNDARIKLKLPDASFSHINFILEQNPAAAARRRGGGRKQARASRTPSRKLSRRKYRSRK